MKKVPISALPQLLGTESAQRNMQQMSKYYQHSEVWNCGCNSKPCEKKEMKFKYYKNRHVKMKYV